MAKEGFYDVLPGSSVRITSDR